MGLFDFLTRDKAPVFKIGIEERHYPVYTNAKGETVEMTPEQYKNVQSESTPEDVSLTYGIATMPMGLGATATKGLATKLMPHFGKKIAQQTAEGIGGGLAGGTVMGGIDAAQNGENVPLGMLTGGAIGAVTGGALGAGGGYIGKSFAKRGLLDNEQAKTNYIYDYLTGLSPDNQRKELDEFRRLWSSGYNTRSENPEILLDQLPQKEFNEWFNGSQIVDSEGKPLLFRDDDNVFITDGYSNNGISRFSYKGSHRAPSSTVTEGTPEYRSENSFDMNLNEVLQGLGPQPDDYFSANGPRWYGYDDAEGLEAFNAIRRVKNGANDITAYRAVPNDVNTNSLNNGDWITFSKKYAKVHGDSNLDGDYRIIEQKVSPNDVWWDGNDIREWGYDNGLPQNPDILLQIRNPYKQETLPNDWMEARAIRNQGYDGIITNDGKYLVFGKDQIKRTGDIENYNSLFEKIMSREKVPELKKDIEATQTNIPPYKESNYYKQRMKRRSARQLSEEDNALYNKIMNTSKELKSPKPVEKSLKKEGEIGIMKGSEPYKKGEQERVLSAASAKYTKNGQLKSNITEEIFDEEDQKYYIHKIYTKDGKTKMKKQVSKDETIFD